jgi:hypothetical protein
VIPHGCLGNCTYPAAPRSLPFETKPASACRIGQPNDQLTCTVFSKKVDPARSVSRDTQSKQKQFFKKILNMVFCEVPGWLPSAAYAMQLARKPDTMTVKL